METIAHGTASGATRSLGISFVKKPARFSAGRLIFTIPPSVAAHLRTGQAYQVTLVPVGTLYAP